MKDSSLREIDIYKIKWALRGEGFIVEVRLCDNDIPLLKVRGRKKTLIDKKDGNSLK